MVFQSVQSLVFVIEWKRATKTQFQKFSLKIFTNVSFYVYLFSNLADAFIQRLTNKDVIEAIKTKKRATTCKCYYKSWLA